MALLMLAVFCCCIPMVMPMQHLVAFCGDLGFAPAHGAAMLSVLLGSAFLSRQFWGWLADRVGGLETLLWSSLAQAVALACFLPTQNEAVLFAVAAAFGLGLSGLLPAYVIAVREFYPATEANWAGADGPVRWISRHGCRWLGGRGAIRSVRLLPPGVRHRPRVQYPEPDRPVVVGAPPAVDAPQPRNG